METRADRLLMLTDLCDFTHKGFPHRSSATTEDMKCLFIESSDPVLDMETEGVSALFEKSDVEGVEHDADVTFTKINGAVIAASDQINYAVKGVQVDNTGFILLKLELQ